MFDSAFIFCLEVSMYASYVFEKNNQKTVVLLWKRHFSWWIRVLWLRKNKISTLLIHQLLWKTCINIITALSLSFSVSSIGVAALGVVAKIFPVTVGLIYAWRSDGDISTAISVKGKPRICFSPLFEAINPLLSCHISWRLMWEIMYYSTLWKV